LIQINRIIEEREGGSVKAFCDKIGVKTALYYMWVKRDGAPSIPVLKKVRAAYNIGIDVLAGEDDPAEDNKNQQKGEDGAVDISVFAKYTQFYVRMWELCRKNSIDLKRLVSDLGMAASLPKLWEEGKEPTKRKKAEIAKYFNVPVEYFTEKRETAIEKAVRAMFDEHGKEFYSEFGTFGARGAASERQGLYEQFAIAKAKREVVDEQIALGTDALSRIESKIDSLVQGVVSDITELKARVDRLEKTNGAVASLEKPDIKQQNG
jgi:transcriptional regulator with XRE-family HTH domain